MLCHLVVELAVDGLASGIDQFEGVGAVAVHLAVTVRDASVGEQEHGLVGGLRPQRDEIPEHIRVLHTPQTIILLSFIFNTFVLPNIYTFLASCCLFWCTLQYQQFILGV